MSQKIVTQKTGMTTQGDEHSHGGTLLGPLLCWAVVFADIGTSVYYVPGILHGTVGNLAGFFVLLTMSVFVLLTLKYAEVTHRFPQGGGVVTVAATSINKWVGALGGMFILVDYFLTASISCLSGMAYLSVVLPVIGASIALPLVGTLQLPILLITIGMLVLLGFLNWVGISESAKVSLVGALIAFASDVAILITVFTHLSFSDFISLFQTMFAHKTLGPVSLLVGFAGSFLAFSGLESISQLSPVMKTPRKKVAGIALFLVVITIGITSPLLTMFSTLLQEREASDHILSTQLISLLGSHWGNGILQTEIAISASALLVFASNTAIIGAYHVFMALSRLGFFPSFVLKRNKLRDTPHYSILLATGIPILILLLVLGDITILGDMYAFGLLGAFTLTCLGLDIIRTRDRRAARALHVKRAGSGGGSAHSPLDTNGLVSDAGAANNGLYGVTPVPSRTPLSRTVRAMWRTLDFWLGILTTGLVAIAWATNLVAKPLATIFGGSVTVLGMSIAYFNYRHQERLGQAPVQVLAWDSIQPMTDAVLVVLLPGQQKHNAAVMQAMLRHAGDRPLAFLYVGEPQVAPVLHPFEYYEPYLYDESALKTFRKVDALARDAKVSPTYLYRSIQQDLGLQDAEIVKSTWRRMHPHELVVAAEDIDVLQDINPDRIRYEITPNGKIAHLISKW